MSEDLGKRIKVGGWKMEDLGFKIEVQRLWIEDRQSRYEDSIMPHQHFLLHTFPFVLCRESHYFEEIIF